MGELAQALSILFKDFTPGAYGIWAGVLMLFAYFAREYRETRKLSAEDRLARRDGYARQVETLMQENRDLMSDIRLLRSDYDEHRRMCQQETNELRQMVIKLEGEVAGYKRRVDTQALEIARLKGVDTENVRRTRRPR